MIVKTPGICGGSARIDRIPVWCIARLIELTVKDAYPQISKENLWAVCEYMAAHREEIEQEIRDQEKPWTEE